MKRKNYLALLSVVLSGMVSITSVPAAVSAEELTTEETSQVIVTDAETDLISEDEQNLQEIIADSAENAGDAAEESDIYSDESMDIVSTSENNEAEEETEPSDTSSGEQESASEDTAVETDEEEVSLPTVTVTGSGSTRTATAVLTDFDVTGVKVAVWSKEGGQDDIKWYKLTNTSDGVWTVEIPVKNLKHAGSCYAHFYSSDNKLIDGTKFTVEEAELPTDSVEVTKADSAPKITVTTVEPVSKLSAAVWSKTGGQDDIVWYTMKQQADGTWTASIDLKKIAHSGTCHVHVYSGKVFVGSTTVTFSEDELPKNSVSVTGSDSKRKAVADIIDSSVKGVKVAVWSSTGGQDDIKWYNLKKASDGTWTADINLFNLKHTGSCYAHFYTNDNVFLGADTFTVAESDIPAAVITVSGSGVTRKVKVQTGSHKNVSAAVWSSTGGQDDIVWYNLTKASDGTWSGNIQLSNLNHSGKVHVHVYADSTSAFLGTGSFTVNENDFNASRDAAAVQAKSLLNSIGRNLQAAFNWSASLTYVSMESSPSVSSSWYASYGFSNKAGNCYVMAGTFYYMAKELGYDAHQVWGYVPSRSGPLTIHSWVEIDINGTTYMFDPQFTNQTGKNGYWFTYGTSGTWRYTSGTRMN